MINPMYMLFFAIFCSVAGQILMKIGMDQVGGIDQFSLPLLINMLLNPWVFTGIGSYGVGFIAYLFALSKLDQSFAYPMFSLGYVLVAVFNWVVLREAFSITRLAGVIVIVFGVWLLAR
jgi:multidrug transporter EmrE-like cation transporter